MGKSILTPFSLLCRPWYSVVFSSTPNPPKYTSSIVKSSRATDYCFLPHPPIEEEIWRVRLERGRKQRSTHSPFHEERYGTEKRNERRERTGREKEGDGREETSVAMGW